MFDSIGNIEGKAGLNRADSYLAIKPGTHCRWILVSLANEKEFLER